MKSNNLQRRLVSRRKILPIIGLGLFFPFFESENYKPSSITKNNNKEYETLLKSDGTVVKVKANTIKKAKIIKKNCSNKLLLKWLGKKSSFN